MSIWNSFGENKARLGKGSGIYTDYYRTDGKFALLVPTVETPFITTETGEVEIKVSSADTISKIVGNKTLNPAETPVYLHRDTHRRLQELNDKTINIISLSSDFTGFKSAVTVNYTPSNATLDDAAQGTVKFTPVSEPEYIDNCFPMLIPTAHFTGAIPSPIGIDGELEVGKEYSFNVTTKPTGATVEAKSEDESIATVTVTEGIVKITAAKEGSTVITLETKLEKHESWKTTILVVVTPKTTAGE